MLKTVIAIVAAAFCAAAMVGFVPPPSPAGAAGAGAADGGNAGCTKPWPYYERACLRDSRKQTGNGSAVRTIAFASHGAPHMPQSRR
jgi:hypothetical protein